MLDAGLDGRVNGRMDAALDVELPIIPEHGRPNGLAAIERLLDQKTTDFPSGSKVGNFQRDALEQLGRQYLEVLTSPEAATIYRLVVGEAPRFPELGEAFFESSRMENFERLAEFLTDLDSKGELDLDGRDPNRCASMFLSMCRGDLFLRKLIQLEESVEENELRAQAELAAEMFIDALG